MRSYKSKDARNFEESTVKSAAPAAVDAIVRVVQPQAGGSFQPGDVVSYRSNTRGVVLVVTGDGVQVDFGLGTGWYSQQSLTLVKAASVSE